MTPSIKENLIKLEIWGCKSPLFPFFMYHWMGHTSYLVLLDDVEKANYLCLEKDGKIKHFYLSKIDFLSIDEAIRVFNKAKSLRNFR